MKGGMNERIQGQLGGGGNEEKRSTRISTREIKKTKKL